MRLLLTRPEPDAQRTAGKLRDLGHEVMLEPLLAVAIAEPPKFETVPAAIVVTSRNGVRALNSWPMAEAWRTALPLFAVGKATAGAAKALGFANVRSADGAVEDLADLVSGSHDRRAGSVLYVAGAARSGDLEGKLRAKGFAGEVIE